jgi:hypothetical protein
MLLPRLRFLRLRSQDKIQLLNLRHSSRLPRIKTLKSRRCRPSCVAIHRVPSVRAMAVCSKLGHNAVDCWDKLDADQAKLDLAKAAHDKKKSDTSKRQPSSKETKAYTDTVASNKDDDDAFYLFFQKQKRPWRPLRPTRTRTTPRVMRLYTAACLIKSSCLIRPALYLIAARKSTSLKEPSDPAPAFSVLVSQAIQPRLKEQMQCFPYSTQMDRATLFQFVARISSPHARQITSCLLQSCSRQDTKSNFALPRTLTPLMVATCTRQRVSALLSFSLAISGAKGGFQIPLVRLHAWPVRVSQRRRGGSPRRPRGLSSPLQLKPPTLLWWLLWPLVWYTLLSIVCILTTLTVSLLGVTRISTI